MKITKTTARIQMIWFYIIAAERWLDRQHHRPRVRIQMIWFYIIVGLAGIILINAYVRTFPGFIGHRDRAGITVGGAMDGQSTLQPGDTIHQLEGVTTDLLPESRIWLRAGNTYTVQYWKYGTEATTENLRITTLTPSRNGFNLYQLALLFGTIPALLAMWGVARYTPDSEKATVAFALFSAALLTTVSEIYFQLNPFGIPNLLRTIPPTLMAGLLVYFHTLAPNRLGGTGTRYFFTAAILLALSYNTLAALGFAEPVAFQTWTILLAGGILFTSFAIRPTVTGRLMIFGFVASAALTLLFLASDTATATSKWFVFLAQVMWPPFYLLANFRSDIPDIAAARIEEVALTNYRLVAFTFPFFILARVLSPVLTLVEPAIDLRSVDTVVSIVILLLLPALKQTPLLWGWMGTKPVPKSAPALTPFVDNPQWAKQLATQEFEKLGIDFAIEVDGVVWRQSVDLQPAIRIVRRGPVTISLCGWEDTDHWLTKKETDYADQVAQRIEEYEELRKAKQALHDLLEQDEKIIANALQKERWNATSRLTQELRHRIGTPLNVLQLMVARLSGKISENELVVIQTSIAGQATIISDLLGGLEQVPTPLSWLGIASVNQAIRSAILLASDDISDAGIKVTEDLAVKEFFMRTSQPALMQVIGHLIDNTLCAFDDEAYGRVIEIGSREGEDGRIIITVKDNGRGIPVDELNLVFDPFTTTGGEAAQGLGLWRVYTTVAQMQGFIGIESGAGAGTTVILSLPKMEGTEG